MDVEKEIDRLKQARMDKFPQILIVKDSIVLCWKRKSDGHIWKKRFDMPKEIGGFLADIDSFNYSKHEVSYER